MACLKNFFLILFVFLSFGCSKKQTEEKSISCIPQQLVTNTLAFYPFSNGSLNDFSGNNHPLSNLTTAQSTSDRNGNSNCAFLFDNLPNSSEYLATTNTSFLNNLTEFSISLWYEAKDSTRNGSDFEVLLSRGSGKSCPDRFGQWSIGLYDCRKAVFGRTNSVWDKNLQPDCNQEIFHRTGGWHHLVATFNNNGMKMAIYRDGILQEFSSGNVSCGSGIPNIQDIGDLFIGKDYTGKLDDLIIFNKYLNQQEVNLLFNLTPCCAQ